ncbi:MAG: CHAP domain-containing protein [Candidatus Aminicenantes bacterium]|nr:CHAP domain-containing protein [Candidatus Aminicenantes bacterium]
MDILKKGSQGETVKELQRLLKAKGFIVVVDGDFGNETLRAVKAFQSQNLDKHGRSLVVDGKVGEITWWSLKNTEPIVVRPVIDYSKMPDAAFMGSDVGRKALQYAIDEMKNEAREIGGDNSGEFVAKYLQPAGLVPPKSWCASFVSWCFLQAVEGVKADMPYNYSVGARNIRGQFRNKGWAFKIGDGSGKLPEPGDIVVWYRFEITDWQGHIGLVHHCFDGFLYTIEGNKSSKVEGFDYKIIDMEKLLGFGRAN